MKTLKKVLKVLSASFFTLLISALLYACASVPKLSKDEKQIISEVIQDPIPEVVQGETGFASSQGHSIWFENIMPKGASKGAIILIMGNGNDALTWPPQLISNFSENGYQVIRYDHRGTGLSVSKEKWKKKKAYALNDMADDVIAILDKLKLKKAHIVGASMGGMIAQIVAIENPKRTISLSKMIGTILKHGFFGNKKGQIKRQIIQKRILMGDATGEIDTKSMAETSLYNLKKRDGYKLMSARHHYEAILKSKSRYKTLRQLEVPALVIHGEKDPVMPISHGKKMVRIIPEADSLWVKNMGHDFPDLALKQITNKMISNFERVTPQ